METARVGNIIQSVAHAQGVSIETLAERPRPLPFFYEVEQDECKGRGRGGEGGSKSCGACTNVLQGDLQGRSVPKLGHSCVLAMIYAGKDPSILPHCQREYKAEKHTAMSPQEAERQLRQKLAAAKKEKKRKKRRRLE